MEYKHFNPEDIIQDEGPTKEALLAQIEADHYWAVQDKNDDLIQVLDARYKKVNAAKTDNTARNAYSSAVRDYQDEQLQEAVTRSEQARIEAEAEATAQATAAQEKIDD